MIIDCVDDLHGYKRKIPGEYLLILSGDYSYVDERYRDPHSAIRLEIE